MFTGFLKRFIIFKPWDAIMEHLTFFILNLAALVVIYYIDRKNLTIHLSLGIMAFFAAIAFEIVPILGGFWVHHSTPKIGLFSVYSFLLYFPFISFSYFLANKIFRIEESV